MSKQTLPIDYFLPEVVEKVTAHSSVIIVAEPGAGKTTRVPVALMNSNPGVWLVLQPRRWAARLTATRIAQENGFQLGSEVGFQVRFENRTSKNTRIILMTEGILLRRMIEDPELIGVAGVVLDEFHERSLDLDLALAILKEIQSSIRPELKIVVMSATLDPAPLERYLLDPVTFQIPGRTFPVVKRYLETENLFQALMSVYPEKGDVLIFLPGAYEIERAVRNLSEELSRIRNFEFEALPLYASLPEEKQKAVFRDSQKRKIICSTNIAETSITLPGVTLVIDTGFQKVMRMDPVLGLDRLETLRISRAAADQRAGRAGRVSEGVCLRLWSEGEQSQLRHFETPEIHRVNLGRALLSLAEFGVRDFQNFDWFEKPKSSMLDFALRELRTLQFFDGNAITERGKKALRLPLEPKVAAIFIAAEEAGVPEFGARFGALIENLSKEDRIRDDEQLIRRLNQLTPIESKTAQQIFKSERIPPLSIDRFPEYEKVLITSGRSKICIKEKMVGRRKVRAREGVLPEASLLLMTMDQGDVLAQSWVPVSLSSLTPYAEKKREVFWDQGAGRVRALEGIFFEDLECAPLTDVPVSKAEAEAFLTQMILKDPTGYLTRNSSFKSWWMRVQFLNESSGEVESRIEISWDEVVPLLVHGKTRLQEVLDLDVLPLMEGLLPRAMLIALDQHAPERIEVPSGSLIKIDYESSPPRLSVRLQEVFGWLETPKLARGKVPLLMELLSPGFKPMQVTRDLRSFWSNAYFEVKKDLKARYPKHSWPEDPLTAKPEAKGRRRN